MPEHNNPSGTPKQSPADAVAPPATPAVAAAIARERGWHVFPVLDGSKSNKKIPAFSGALSNGRNWGASNDPEFVAAQFAKRRAHNAWIGLATGPESGVFVWDVDTLDGHGKDGPASHAALIDMYGLFPHTRTALTPSGGLHYYFSYPTDGRKVVSRALRDVYGKVVEGIDIKGHGGYVVTVPSKGRVWLDEQAPIADAPDWMLSLVTEQQRPNREKISRRTSGKMTFEEVRWDRLPHLIHPPSNPQFIAPVEVVAMMCEDGGLGISLDPLDHPENEYLRIKHALEAIPNDGQIEYEEWVLIGGAVFGYLGDLGFGLFDDFSKKYARYDSSFTVFKWFQNNGIEGLHVDASKIFWHANQCDPSKIYQLRYLAAYEAVIIAGCGV